VAVLAIAAADGIGRRDCACPDRRRRALRNGLELEVRLARGACRCIDALDQLLDPLLADMAGELGLDAAGMDGGRPDSVPLMAAIELDREQDVGGLRPSIGCPWVIRRPLEIGIVEIDVGNSGGQPKTD
jgi:hypothetical protein